MFLKKNRGPSLDSLFTAWHRDGLTGSASIPPAKDSSQESVLCFLTC